MRIPRETAAFAAGIACLCRNYHVIAATLAQIGLGVFTPEEVRAAAEEWCDTHTIREAIPVGEAIDRTRPQAPS
jgi:hypothetical protein